MQLAKYFFRFLKKTFWIHPERFTHERVSLVCGVIANAILIGLGVISFLAIFAFYSVLPPNRFISGLVVLVPFALFMVIVFCIGLYGILGEIDDAYRRGRNSRP